MKIIIGRTDVVDFPKLELFGIDIKIDTGAYTSSLHCHNIEVKNNVLYCQFLDPGHDQYHEKVFSFKEFTEKVIKSSNGSSEKRYIISTEILIFNTLHLVDLSLTERDTMKYPVLLGRKFISGKYVVDTSRTKLSQKNKIINITKT